MLVTIARRRQRSPASARHQYANQRIKAAEIRLAACTVVSQIHCASVSTRAIKTKSTVKQISQQAAEMRHCAPLVAIPRDILGCSGTHLLSLRVGDATLYYENCLLGLDAFISLTR